LAFQPFTGHDDCFHSEPFTGLNGFLEQSIQIVAVPYESSKIAPSSAPNGIDLPQSKQCASSSLLMIVFIVGYLVSRKSTVRILRALSAFPFAVLLCAVAFRLVMTRV
jgi:hypothetical protein